MEESNKFWERDFNFIKGEYHLKIADICAKDLFQYDNAAVNYRKSVYAFTSGTAYYLNYYTLIITLTQFRLVRILMMTIFSINQMDMMSIVIISQQYCYLNLHLYINAY